MNYQDQLAIGNAFNEAIHRVLADYGIAYYDQPGMVSALAQAILVALDQANYQIVRSSQEMISILLRPLEIIADRYHRS
jgi:hypothetical protein